MISTNVLILGKTGVGKSSLINYIFGQKVREKGSGKPVTEKGIYKEKIKINNLLINLYDTWGLESNDADTWEQEILGKVREHDESNEIKDWFHTVFYCFSIQSARVDEFEINKIIRPLKENGTKVCIILTHVDVNNSDEKKKGMIERLLIEDFIQENDIICVASEKKKLLSGKVVEQFGKKQVLKKMQENLWITIQDKLVYRYDCMLREKIEDWKDNSFSIVEHKVTSFNQSTIEKKLVKTLQRDLETKIYEMKNETKEYIRKAYTYYIQLIHVINGYERGFESKLEEFFADYSMELDKDFTEVLAEKLTTALFLLIPIIQFFVPYALKEIRQDEIKDKIQNVYEKMLEEVPEQVSDFEKFIRHIKQYQLSAG